MSPVDSSGVLTDKEVFGKALSAFLGMVSGEEFDHFVAYGPQSIALSGAMSDRLGKGMLVYCHGGIPEEIVGPGSRVVLVMDTFKDGENELKVIGNIESSGCKVVKICFVKEDTSYDGRAGRRLDKYPFDCYKVV